MYNYGDHVEYRIGESSVWNKGQIYAVFQDHAVIYIHESGKGPNLVDCPLENVRAVGDG